MNPSSAVLNAPRRRASAHPLEGLGGVTWVTALLMVALATLFRGCLLYTSDAADE